MIVEILFPEVCSLFGERGNIDYLKLALPDAAFIETSLLDEPAFAKQDIDLLYLGPMSEDTQKKVIERLRPYQARLDALIEKGVFMLFTGNALDILGASIVYDDTESVMGLGLFDFVAEVHLMKRFNSKILGTYRDMEIVGQKTQFSMVYGNNDDCYFLNVKTGIGNNPETMLDGYVRHNLIATHLIGPLLIMNPYFTKYYLEKLCGHSLTLPLFAEMVDAYQDMLDDFRKLGTAKK